MGATEIQSLNNEVHDLMNDHQGEVSDLNGKIESLKISYEKKVAEISKERDSLEAKLEGLSITKSVMSEDGRKEKEMAAEIESLKAKYEEKKDLVRKLVMDEIEMVCKKEEEINALKASEQILVVELKRSQNEKIDLCGQINYLQDQHKKDMVDLQANIKTLETLKISNEKRVADINRERDSLEAKLEGLIRAKSVMSENVKVINYIQDQHEREACTES